MDLPDDLQQPVVFIELRHRGPQGWSKPVRTLAVVDTALSVSTVPPEIAEALGFEPPLFGPKRRIETGMGAVDYHVAEVELRIDGQERTLRANIGFGGTRRSVHLGYLKVLQHFRADFRPYEGTFSLEYVR